MQEGRPVAPQWAACHGATGLPCPAEGGDGGVVGRRESAAGGAGKGEATPDIGRRGGGIGASGIGVMRRRQHAHELPHVRRQGPDLQLAVGQPAAVPADRAIDPRGGFREAAPRPTGMLTKATVQQSTIGTGARGRLGGPPGQPADRLCQPPGITGLPGERMALREPLEQGQTEQVALPFVDRDGEVVVERIAERMTDEKRTAAMHAQRVDRRLADTRARHHLRRDGLELTRLAGVDRGRSPGGDRVAGDDRGGDASQSPLHELAGGDRPAPRGAACRVVTRLCKEQPQCAGGLRREGDAAAVEAVPDDLHAVAARWRREQIGLVHLEGGEFKRGVGRMLERMDRVVPQPEARRVVVRTCRLPAG